jgi:micrococcal nuclease
MFFSSCGIPGMAHDPQCLIQAERVIDGDTFVISTLTLFGPDIIPVALPTSIRLVRVDTPERGQPEYKEAKDFLTALIEGGVYLEVIARDSFGRWLAEVYICDNDNKKYNVNDRLINEGWVYRR